ncbi:MAG TPA: glycosyltransferase, partial [Candidatus Saccharimonadales bacterium]|nr:glycosyltransferase [Candidatus Saccharimonadales bacterium]
MNRPRVLHILTRLGMGGSARQVIEISRRILGSFDVAIATGPEEEGEGSLHREAVAARIPVWVIPSLRRRGYLLRDRRALRELARILRSLQPAVVHTHHAKAGVLGRMAARQAKVGCTVHTFHEPLERLDRDGLLHKANVAAERRLAEATGRLIAVSESVKADLVSHEVAVPAKISVIPPLIEPARFRPARINDVRRVTGIPADAPLVGMVGRLVRAKDPALFLRVFAAIASALPEARAIVAGDGPERSAMERTARRMDISERISFLGWTSDVAAVYDALDLLIVTSRREGFALAAVEAMSAGTAV